MMYAIDQELHLKSGFIRIDFAECQGKSKLLIVDKPDGHSTSVSSVNLTQREEFGRTYYYVPLPRDNLYIMVKPDNGQDWDGGALDYEPSEYMLKVGLTFTNISRKFEFMY